MRSAQLLARPRRPLFAGRTIDAELTSVMAAACAAGALAGVILGAPIPQRILGRAFAGLVAAVAVYLLLSVAVLGGPPGSG